jgi:hypothetical protein
MQQACIRAIPACEISIGQRTKLMLELIRMFALEQAAVARSLVARHALRWRPAPTPVPLPQPPPLAREDQWGHVTGILASAIAHCERIEAWHFAAAEHIDAADYTFQRLLGELAAVLPIAADGAPLRAILAEAARSRPAAPARKALAA